MKKKDNNSAIFDHGATVYGSATIGSKGQLVIPAKARKDMRLKSGDRLLVVGRFNKILGLIKPEEMTQMLEHMLNQLKGSK